MRKAIVGCLIAVLFGIAIGILVSKNFDITALPVAPPIQSDFCIESDSKICRYGSMAEHGPCNADVVGSTPTAGSSSNLWQEVLV